MGRPSRFQLTLLARLRYGRCINAGVWECTLAQEMGRLSFPKPQFGLRWSEYKEEKKHRTACGGQRVPMTAMSHGTGLPSTVFRELPAPPQINAGKNGQSLETNAKS